MCSRIFRFFSPIKTRSSSTRKSSEKKNSIPSRTISSMGSLEASAAVARARPRSVLALKMYSAVARTRLSFVGKWCSCAPRETPAIRETSSVRRPAYPFRRSTTAAASSSRCCIVRERSAWLRRLGFFRLKGRAMSQHRAAAVHADDLPGDEGGFLRCEVADHGGHLRHLRRSTQGNDGEELACERRILL